MKEGYFMEVSQIVRAINMITVFDTNYSKTPIYQASGGKGSGLVFGGWGWGR